MSKSRDIHVFFHRRSMRWVVKRGRRTLSFHRKQATAVKPAVRHGKRHRVDVVIHGRNGRIRSKDNYFNETRIRDTEH